MNQMSMKAVMQEWTPMAAVGHRNLTLVPKRGDISHISRSISPTAGLLARVVDEKLPHAYNPGWIDWLADGLMCAAVGAERWPAKLSAVVSC